MQEYNRKQKNLNQAELGKILHVSQQTIGSWETGRAIPGSDTLNILADYFGTSTDELLGREEHFTDSDLDEMIDNAHSYDGKPVDDHDRTLIKQYLKALFSNKQGDCMDSHLKRLLKKYNLKIQYGPTHGDGCIVETPDGYPDLLIVKEGLSDEQTEKVILHELGHAENDDKTQSDYKTNYTTRLHSECGANNFVVHEQIKKYVDLGNDVASANWLDLAKYIGTDNYWLVQEELLKYGIK